MLHILVRETRRLDLQERIGLYLALSPNNNTFFFFMMTFLSLLIGIAGLMGVIVSFLFATFSLVIFLTSFAILSLALNWLTFLLLSRRILKQHSLPLPNDFASRQILTTLAYTIGLMICPLLLPIMALLQISKNSR